MRAQNINGPQQCQSVEENNVTMRAKNVDDPQQCHSVEENNVTVRQLKSNNFQVSESVSKQSSKTKDSNKVQTAKIMVVP